MVAVEKMDKDLVELSLAHKANLDTQSPHGSAPLHFLVGSAYQAPLEKVSAIAELLLSAGPNVNLQNNDGKTPLNLLVNSPQPQPSSPQSAICSKIAELLRAHGALANLPRLDVIEIRRSDPNLSTVIFTKGTNGWDHFTLFEALGVKYSLVTASPKGGGRGIVAGSTNFVPPGSGLEFPDFTRVRLRRPKSDFKAWEERTINIASALNSGDCSPDIRLELGDQIEIPEADPEKVPHPSDFHHHQRSIRTHYACAKLHN
jgi:hypothetical protein